MPENKQNRKKLYEAWLEADREFQEKRKQDIFIVSLVLNILTWQIPKESYIQTNQEKLKFFLWLVCTPVFWGIIIGNIPSEIKGVAEFSNWLYLNFKDIF